MRNRTGPALAGMAAAGSARRSEKYGRFQEGCNVVVGGNTSVRECAPNSPRMRAQVLCARGCGANLGAPRAAGTHGVEAYMRLQLDDRREVREARDDVHIPPIQYLQRLKSPPPVMPTCWVP